MTEKRVRAVDEIRDRANAKTERFCLPTECAHEEAEREGHRNRDQKAEDQRAGANTDTAPIGGVDAERDADDRCVLGTDHHRADDQDLGVREDADGGDQSRDGEQHEPARRITAPGSDSGLGLRPDWREIERAWCPSLRLGCPV
jgi:hypothetical protein